MRIEVSANIKGDLRKIGEYIAKDNPSRAISFIGEIRAKFREIGSMPKLYRLRPELGLDRRVAFHRDYAIVFRICSDAKGAFVLIEYVLHGSRDLVALFNKAERT